MKIYSVNILKYKDDNSSLDYNRELFFETYGDAFEYFNKLREELKYGNGWVQLSEYKLKNKPKREMYISLLNHRGYMKTCKPVLYFRVKNIRRM